MQFKVEFRHKSFLFLRKENQNAGGYTCLVKDMNLIDNTGKLTIVGTHQDNESDRSVVGLSIRKIPHLQKFPRGFGEIFPNLKYFEIDGSDIKMLRKEDFLDLDHLQGLWMPRNPIVSLPNDLFSNVQGLRYLSFHQNKLKYIGQHTLNPLKNLERANFCENTTIDLAYDGEEQQLEALKSEIAAKCMPLTFASSKLEPSDSGKNADYEKRIQYLELKVSMLESEKDLQASRLSQLAVITQMMENLQSRIDVMENLFV